MLLVFVGVEEILLPSYVLLLCLLYFWEVQLWGISRYSKSDASIVFARRADVELENKVLFLS